MRCKPVTVRTPTAQAASGWGTSWTPIALQNDIGAPSAQTLRGLTGECPNGLDAPLSRKSDLPLAVAAHDAAHTKQHTSSAFDIGKTLCCKHDDRPMIMQLSHQKFAATCTHPCKKSLPHARTLAVGLGWAGLGWVGLREGQRWLLDADWDENMKKLKFWCGF